MRHPSKLQDKAATHKIRQVKDTPPPMKKKIITLTLTLTLIFAALQTVKFTTYEDNSWSIGNYPYLISGCFPFGICND